MKIKSRKDEDSETLVSGPEGNWPFPADAPPADPVEDWFEEVLRRTTQGVPDQTWIETSDY